MGTIHTKSAVLQGKRPRRTGEKVAQNTGIDFLALRLGVVLDLLRFAILGCFREFGVFFFQPAPKYHTKGCSHTSADSPGARTLVFVAFEPCFIGVNFGRQ